MKILTILGARPQFIKSSLVSQVFDSSGIEEVVLHTGQHYDENMSGVFFKELKLKTPYKNLGCGNGSHAEMTSRMMIGIEFEIAKEKPDLVLVYGDTNSTLAGALVASKMDTPIAHVEAGLRCGVKSMPEEINRILTDHASDYLFAPTSIAGSSLLQENIRDGVHVVGDVMVELLLKFKDQILAKKRSIKAPYNVLTIHRQENTQDPEAFAEILSALNTSKTKFLFPMHPRTENFMRKHHLKLPEQIKALPPQTYFDMMGLIAHSEMVFTDSGGLQKEAVVLGKPVVTLRSQTEWIETVWSGWNILLGNTPAMIRSFMAGEKKHREREPFDASRYGDGKAAERIVKVLL